MFRNFMVVIYNSQAQPFPVTGIDSANSGRNGTDMEETMTELQGTPCWYELTTKDLDAAEAFYGKVIGWDISDSGMEGMDYRLAKAGGSMVAGLMAMPEAPTFWLLYFAVDDCDATARAAEAEGATVHRPPTDIPGVGRFAILTDPQNASFAILQPLPGSEGGAFDQAKLGHGNWHELYATDPEAALAFYGKLFGWTESRRMDMGEMGFYHLIAHNGTEIGGVFDPGPGAPPHWLPYFGVDGAESALARITGGGGTLRNGPMEVPGGAWIVQAADPQGAGFAVVGPK
jgi:predicted enzyme related to lactoylglutathione lyase